MILDDAVHVQDEDNLSGFHSKFLLCQSKQFLYAFFWGRSGLMVAFFMAILG